MINPYTKLEIFQDSLSAFYITHAFSLKLPKHELYELGSQVRRSADAINSNIVEGYGRRRYKNDYIKFLIYSHSSNDETINHLRKIVVLYPDLKDEGDSLIEYYQIIGAKLNKFIAYIENNK